MFGKVSGSLLISILALVVAIGAYFSPFNSVTPSANSLDDMLKGSGTQSTSIDIDPKNQFVSRNPSLVADVAEQLAPSVVNIDVARKQTVYYRDFLGPFFGFEDFFGNGGQRSQTRIVEGSGSGFIIDNEGHIITNNHVIAQADEIVVTLQDNRKVSATLVGQDAFSDLAVLKIDGKNLTPATLGNSSNLRPGEWVLAMGSPLGFDHTVTLGIVSAISRYLPDINQNANFIQTDAAINPGNSGGPLVSISGEVIGINTAISGMGQNIGFAIPVDDAKIVVQQLIENGEFKRPYIGIAMTDLSPQLLEELNIDPTIKGTLVTQVASNSPAILSGLQAGDIIQEINNHPVLTPDDVRSTILNNDAGSEFKLDVLRNGKNKKLTVKSDVRH